MIALPLHRQAAVELDEAAHEKQVGDVFASYTEAENGRLNRDAGLEIVRDEISTIREPEGEGRFHWILARKPPSRGGGLRSGRE